MSARWAALLTALALLTPLLPTGAMAASAEAAPRPHGKKKQRARVGVAERIAVERSRKPKRRQLGNDAIALPPPAINPFAFGPNDAIGNDPQRVIPPAPPKACTELVADVDSAEAAIRGAAPGAVVCLANGSYGPVSLSGSKAAPVTLQAEHPGAATLDGVTVSGSRLAVERFLISDEVVVQPGSAAIEIAYNRISGGYFGVDAGPTTTTTVDDTRIVGNQFIGPFGEDAIHLNRYHDGDGDGVGILIEGNEITNVRENGNHSDCLQTVWVGDHIVFRANYLHDNRCQGFFIKDQDVGGEGGSAGPVVGIAIENNLFLRNDAPCAPEAPECGEPSYLHLYGPYSELTMRRNTFWGGDPVASFQEGTGPDTRIEANVAYRLWTSTDLAAIAYTDNTRCQRDESETGAWPSTVSGEVVDCAPAFRDPASDDYRLAGSSRGVTWAPADLHFGP